MKLIGGNSSSISNLNLYKDYINHIDQFEAFRKVVGYTPEIGVAKYKSLFRPDNKGTCRYELHDGKIFFIDNAGHNGKIAFDIYAVLAETRGMSFREACEFFLKENIISQTTQYSTHSYPIKIRFTHTKWKGNEDYLKDYKISPNYMNHQPYFKVVDYWVTTKKDNSFKKNMLYNPKEYTTIAYYFADTDTVKLYWYKGNRETKGKFYTNCNPDDIFGFHRIHEYDDCDTLWILKSGKEDAILNYHLGLCTLGVQSESVFYDEKLLSACEQFPNIMILYDNDDTGKKYSKLRKDDLITLFPDKNIYDVRVPSPLNDVGNILEKNYDLSSILAGMYNFATNG